MTPVERKARVEEIRDTKASIDFLLEECDRLREALNGIIAQTHSWVIEEETINCKHAYGEIRRIAREVLDGES